MICVYEVGKCDNFFSLRTLRYAVHVQTSFTLNYSCIPSLGNTVPLTSGKILLHFFFAGFSNFTYKQINRLTPFYDLLFPNLPTRYPVLLTASETTEFFS